MKAMLLLAALMAGSGSAWAEEVTFSYTEYIKEGGSSGAGAEYTMEKTDVSITNTLFFGNNSHAHFYAYGTTTITPKNGVTITKIVLTATATSYNGYQSKGAITTSTGKVSGSSNSTTVTWNGSATDAFTIYNDKQIRWTSIVVTYTPAAFTSAAAVPIFSVESGTYVAIQSVTISSDGASEIWYTTDGTDPIADGVSPQIVEGTSAVVNVTSGMQIWARGIDSDANESALAKATYVIKPSAPDIFPANHTYTGTTDVSFTQAENASIYYTTDGSEPTINSTLYENSFSINQNLTIKAIAVDAYGNMSEVAEATFHNSELQATLIDVIFNNDFLGTSEGGRITQTTTVVKDNVSFIFDKTSGSNWPQGDAGVIRIYSGTTLEIAAPDGYLVTKVVFTKNGDWKNGMTADSGIYDDETSLTWTGSATSVTFSPGGTHRIATCTVTLALRLSIGNAGYATYVAKNNVMFPNGVSAYIVNKISATSVSMTEVEAVAKGTPVIVKAAKAEYALIETATTDNISANLLRVSDGTATDVYVLANPDGEVGFYKYSGSGLDEGRVYLDAPTEAREFLSFAFSEANGIEHVENGKISFENAIYDLQGRRVMKPANGLYIVDGKKVMVK